LETIPKTEHFCSVFWKQFLTQTTFVVFWERLPKNHEES
jgi:hypothetical protein